MNDNLFAPGERVHQFSSIVYHKQIDMFKRGPFALGGTVIRLYPRSVFEQWDHGFPSRTLHPIEFLHRGEPPEGMPNGFEQDA